MPLSDTDIYTLEADGYNGVAVETLHFTGNGPGYRTGVSDTPPSTSYLPWLSQSMMLARDAFGDRRTSGKAPPAVGALTLLNPLGVIDKYFSYDFDGRAATVRRGQAAGAYPSTWLQTLNATMHPWAWSRDGVRVTVFDAQKYAAVPLQPTLYAGTNVGGVGLEGTAADLKGKPKPVPIGRSFNVPAVPVDPQKLIYQAGDVALAGITAVRDGGLDLGASPSGVYSSVTHGLTAPVFGSHNARGNGVVVLCNTGGNYVATSADTDGLTWVARATGLALNPAVAWNGTTFVAVMADQVNGIATSTTGTSGWTLRNAASTSTDDFRDVTWSAFLGLFVAVGSNGKIQTSPTGTTWTARTSGTAYNLKAVASSNNRLVAIGDNGVNGIFITSADGITWVSVTLPFGATDLVHDLRFGNGTFVATSQNKSIAISPDGLSWTNVNTAATYGGYTGLSISPKGYWATGANTGTFVMSSDNGQTWSLVVGGDASHQPESFVFTDSFTLILYTGGTMYRLATGGTTYASLADLQDDTKSPPPGSVGFYLAGAYFRLGSPPANTITCDVLEGATTADRTPAQCWTRVLQRAALAASANLVTNPNALASGWNTSGTLTPTNAALSLFGFSFSRMANTNAGDCARNVTFTGNAQKLCSWLIKADGTNAGFSHVGVFDITASVWRLRLAYTIASDGSLTVAAEAGSVVRVENCGQGIYLVTGLSTTVTASNTNEVVANAVGGTSNSTLTTVLMSAVRVSNASVLDGWSTFDVTKLDSQNAAEVGKWYGPNDAGVLCGDAAQWFADTAGAAMFADAYGQLRLKRLSDPATNLVSHGDDLASSPWAAGSGSPSAASNVAMYAGRHFSRVSNATSGAWSQLITLPVDGTYYLTVYVKSDGHAGTVEHILQDNTVPVSRARFTSTIASDGSITFAVTAGTLVRSVLVAGGEQVYAVTMKAPGCIAAHQHFVYATNPGTVSSVLLSGITVLQGDPIATITQSDCASSSGESGEPTPLTSGDDNEGIPPYRAVIRWGQNHTVQTPDQLEWAVSDADVLLYGLDWRSAISESATTHTAHPLSQPLQRDLLYAVEADALTEAARVQALLGADRFWFTVTVNMTDTYAAVEIGDVVEAVYARFGLDVGARFVVMGIKPEALDGGSTVITFTLWR